MRTREARRPWLKVAGFVMLTLVVVSVSLVLPLRWLDPPTSAFMLQDGSGRVPVRFQWAEWSDLGTAPVLAVVAAEDQRFLEHYGFDFAALQKALRDSAGGQRLRGASTISQQLAKNLYLWPGRSYLRKGLEGWFALLLEVCLPKRRILELYLNVVELAPGVYGVPAASREFFGREPSQISDGQAALLAAVLPNPRALNAGRPSAYVQERQHWIHSQMQRLRREYWLSQLE